MEQNKPLLSVGIIFKNEIRCLERCLKSFQPLRERIPLEIVMADTGSDDGSREVAAKYADVLFDFPWIDDFAAARNAVLDRCSGVWHLQLDADEWLDTDTSELEIFLKHQDSAIQYVGAVVMIRNYITPDLSGDFSDMLLGRILRLSSGIRFTGSIHEHWDTHGGVRLCSLMHTLLHHDGYAFANTAFGRAKLERNMALLRKEQEAHPEDMRILLQCVESSDGEERERYTRSAIDGIRKKFPAWETFGPSVFRNAVLLAKERNLPDLDSWAAEAAQLFPDSLFIKIDIGANLCAQRMKEEKYAEAIPFGDTYLRTLADFRAGRYKLSDLASGTLTMTSPGREMLIRAFLASAFFHEKRYQDACEVIKDLDGAELAPEGAEYFVKVLIDLQARGGVDMSLAMTRFWEQISKPRPSETIAEERKKEVIRAGMRTFPAEYRAREDAEGSRHAFSLFLPLAGKCVIGDMAAVVGFDWTKAEEDRETAWGLAAALAYGERTYLPRCYLTEALEGMYPLPPIHRIGLCSAKRSP